MVGKHDTIGEALHSSAEINIRKFVNEREAEIRRPKVTELARKLLSSLTYQNAGEALPRDRANETVSGLLQGIKKGDIDQLYDLLQREGVKDEIKLTGPINARIREIENGPSVATSEPAAEGLPQSRAVSG